MRSFFVMLMALASVFGIPVDDTSSLGHPKWIEWKLKHKKVYKNTKEETVRNFIWQENLHQIVKHNQDSNSTFKMGLNQLSDLTLNEMKRTVTGCYKIPAENIVNGKLKKHPNATTFLKPSNVNIPDSVDWRQYGYVTPVKNQGQCGSCWAFSSTGSLEGQHFRSTGKLVSLSEQNLVDCCRANSACSGGWMDNSFAYIKSNNGIDTESSYPYYARALGYCYFNARNIGATDSGFVDITSGDENALKIAVATIGPISVAIDATHASFQSYKSGVYYEPACGNALSNLDHAVLVVGYGTENGQDYWLVKNSWATWWGENGYIKMLRNYNDMCGIALKASYPLV